MNDAIKRKYWSPDQIRHEIFLDEVSKSCILTMLRRGQIPSIRMGKRWFIPASWVNSHLEVDVEPQK